ncbi:uncharacterized protein J4E87_002076 [Alternaria ethzedia]|uniref:uncharacterized protein n=1 Tax=Alternaria ethzedia TaxID=181014 RepID=UPI0020C4153F|nr:uncharacterized protein J4E87_002076 [Alternaria ethzedia]KAI4632602.1 hypothetical protein J4E87_002076 [Alternaria ethzedia]
MSAETQMPISSPTTSDVWPGYTCLFSQLSGELRNRIYDYILEDEPASIIHVHYNPNSALLFRERYAKHKYMGLTQVDRKTRREFAPLYDSGLYFHFSQLARFYRSGLAGKNDAYPALVRLLSKIRKRPSPAATGIDSSNPGLDVTLLFRLDPYNCDVTGRWFLDTEYKSHRNGLMTGILCRMLACLPSWYHLLEPGAITKISILKSRYRSGKSFILVTLELDSEIEISRAAIVHAHVERALVAEMDFSMPDSGPAASHNF